MKNRQIQINVIAVSTLLLILIVSITFAIYYLSEGESIFSSNSSTSNKKIKTDVHITVSANDLALNATRFLDLVSDTNTGAAALTCPSNSDTCDATLPSSSGAIGWRVLARASIYKLNPTAQNKKLLEDDFKILSEMESEVPFVNGSGPFLAFEVTKDPVYARYAFAHAAQLSAEFSLHPIPDLGAMLLGMIGKELAQTATLTKDTIFIKSQIDFVQNNARTNGRTIKSAEEIEKELLESSTRMQDQAVRVEDALQLIVKNSHSSYVFPTDTNNTMDPSLKKSCTELNKNATVVSQEWAHARCWSAEVSATIFSLNGDPHYKDIALEDIKTISLNNILSNKYSGDIAPAPFITCIDAGQTLLEVGLNSEESVLINNITTQLLQNVVVNLLDARQRPYCIGNGAIMSSWPAKITLDDITSGNLSKKCDYTMMAVSDTSQAIDVLSRAKSNFNLDSYRNE